MTDPAAPLLEARAISKSFAQTRALVGANLTLRPGVTHALLGANGAGKSTLSRVISGHVRRDGGEILYRGEPLDVRSPREALDAGIAMVMQETSLAPDLSVLENIFLPDLGRPGRLSRPTMRRRASRFSPIWVKSMRSRSTRRRVIFPPHSASWSRLRKRSR